MGLLTFSINVTLDGCVDHQEGIVDDETHAFADAARRRRASSGMRRKLASSRAGLRSTGKSAELGDDIP
jgi:hypothetical protein